MHDPDTLAFSIKIPWIRLRPNMPIVVGKDGQTFQHDMSHFNPFGLKHTRWIELATIWHSDPCIGGSDDSCDWSNRKGKRFKIHPKFHIWHWTIRFWPSLFFKRWAFSRCAECGGRFSWRDVRRGHIESLSWNSEGPTWFRNGERVRHGGDCPVVTPMDRLLGRKRS